MKLLILDRTLDSPIDSRQEFKRCLFNIVVLLSVNITVTVIKRCKQKTFIYFQFLFMLSSAYSH